MKASEISLLTEIERVSKDIVSPFHMPGHKKGAIGSFDAFNVDLTEIPGIDNLHCPKGIIKDAQNRASREFGADRSYFSVNGSTGCNHAVMLSQLRAGEKVLVISDAHKSVYTGIMLARGNLEIFHPIMSRDGFISLGVDLLSLSKRLENDDSIKMIVATYPNYYGYGFDLEKLVEISNLYGCILLVDNAHGAHLKWMEDIPNTLVCPVKAGADIVVQSAHKTLPSMTQSALIHVNTGNSTKSLVNVERLEYYLSLLQTSSPSYPLMASIDMGILYMKKQGNKALKELYKNISDFKAWARSMGICPYEDFLDVVHAKVDFSKVAITSFNLASDGIKLSNILRSKYGIYPELENHNGVLFYTSIANTRDDFEHLKYALSEILKDNKTSQKDDNIFKEINFSKLYGEREISKGFSETLALSQEYHEYVSPDNAVGRVSSDFLIPYPPGIPSLIPGQLICQGVIDAIESFLSHGSTVMGIKYIEGKANIKVLR